VGDDDEGGLVFFDEVEKEGDNFLAIFGVKVAGGFISEDNGGGVDDGAGNGDTLLFAA